MRSFTGRHGKIWSPENVGVRAFAGADTKLSGGFGRVDVSASCRFLWSYLLTDDLTFGTWGERAALLPKEKLARLFPGFDPDNPAFRGIPAGLSGEEYFVFYDDSVFEAEEETPAPGSGGWGFGQGNVI